MTGIEKKNFSIKIRAKKYTAGLAIKMASKFSSTTIL
jgi:hypothetical protein